MPRRVVSTSGSSGIGDRSHVAAHDDKTITERACVGVVDVGEIVFTESFGARRLKGLAARVQGIAHCDVQKPVYSQASSIQVASLVSILQDFK
jgi:hypothetical protein